MMPDLPSVADRRSYDYCIGDYRSKGYGLWRDGVVIYFVLWKADITESTNPTGDYSGYWSGASLSSESYVGDYSVRFNVYQNSYTSLYYYFDQPTDLSAAKAMRFFLLVKDSNGGYINYCRYWPYSGYYNLYVYDANGMYCNYRVYQNAYTYYTYEYSYPGSNNGGAWYAHSMAWGEGPAYSNSGIDFTQITSFRLANFYNNYVYGSSVYPMQYHIDGLEWYAPVQGARSPDIIPYAIYMDGGDLTVSGDSTITGVGKVGARIVSWGGDTTLNYLKQFMIG